tara:strand:- start:10755 stop:10943 length:189 start_codon:yes stop_codon:yes gene_type:complete
MKTYKILYIEENEIHEWSLQEIIEYINADRSNEWTDYNESDWKEGWDEWVKGEGYYKLITKK